MSKRKIKISIALAFIFGVTGAMSLGLVIVRRTLEGLPSVDSLGQYVPPLVTKVLDMNGLAVGEFFTERRTTVPLIRIPMDLRAAVIATEDSDFYHHWGIDPLSILRAALANFRAGRVVQGGSTLTQQLSKTIYLTREKTIVRKFKELLLTLQIEFRYSKDEILELYLNQIYFGGGAYGVEAASQLYFDKNTQELNLPECALLAGLIRSPNRYSPLRDPEVARGRREIVLGRMNKMGFITEAEEKEANEFPIAEPAFRRGRQAPYFVEEIKKMLEPRFGTEMLEQSGLTIHSTLDLKVQQAAEEIMERHLTNYDVKYGTATLEEYNRDLQRSTTQHVDISTTPPNIQGAAIILDVHTGAIRAMIGGRNFSTSQFNRATQAQRQPGSSFKPFVWAAAMEQNFTAATIFDDYPLVYVDVESDPVLLAETTTYAQTELAILDHLQMTEEDLYTKKDEERKEILKNYWRPQNYDAKYLGPMTLRTGLQKSRNLISIRLINAIGPRSVVQLAYKAGVNSRLSAVLSLALGTSVVNLMELANAYGTFASGGLYAEPYYYDRITDRRGSLVEEVTPKIEARIDPKTCFLITNLLQGVVQRGTGWFARRLGRPLGGKTGTTQDQRDLLFIGFSPDLVAGVWVGYDDFRPLKKGLSASSIAVPLWTDIMREAFKGHRVEPFPVPPGIEYAKIHRDKGCLALPGSSKVILEAFRQGTVPQDFCADDEDYGLPVEETPSE